MSRVAYERVFGQSGYDAVARNKIKKLEEQIGGGSGGGIPTAIIKQDGYDNAAMGVAAAVEQTEPTYTCTNMTFEEAREIILNGQALRAMSMSYEQGEGYIEFNISNFVSVNFIRNNQGDHIELFDDVLTLEWRQEGVQIPIAPM